MGRGHAATRITARDLAGSGGVAGLISGLVSKLATNGSTDEAKELAAMQLRSLGEQGHGQHQEALFSAGAIAPLVAD